MYKSRYCIILFLLLLTGRAYSQYDTIRTYYPNGSIRELLPRYQGRVEGIGKIFYENGCLCEERTYSAGKVAGLVKQYDENGRLAATFTIDNGKREGPYTTFNASGGILNEVFYVNGKIETPDTLEQMSAAVPVNTDIAPPPITTDTASAAKKTAAAVTTDQKSNADSPKTIASEPKSAVIEKDTISLLLSRDTLYIDLTIPANPLLSRLSQTPAPTAGWDSFYKKVIYPEFARNKKISGLVIISALLDKTGEVQKTRIIKGIGYGCDDAAEIAVFYTKYLPAIAGSIKKPCELIIPIEFK